MSVDLQLQGPQQHPLSLPLKTGCQIFLNGNVEGTMCGANAAAD